MNIQRNSYEDWFRDKRPAESLYKSEKENCFMYPFQVKAAIEIFNKLFCENKRAVLLNGGVGIGKTFILGKLLNDFKESLFLDSRISEGIYPLCIFPIFYITKASIIEQTRRVLVNIFNLDPHTDFLLTNYDQLRSNFGKLYIERQTKIEYGVEYEKFEWKLGHPLLFVLDEVQAVKNEDSQQSKVFQALNEVEHPLLRIIFSSATPFTKVSEAKVITVATRLNIYE